MRVNEIVAAGLALLGAWGVFAGRKAPKMVGAWSARRLGLVLVGVLFIGGSWLCAAGLYWGWFRPWMMLPLGASYLGMLALPCYIEAVDRIPWLHTLRNVCFIAVALFCFAIAFGLVPLAWLGLS